MRTFIAISAVSLAVAACGGAEEAEAPAETGTMAEGEMMTEDTAMMGGDMAGDPMAGDPMAAGEDMMASAGAVTVNVSGIEPGPGQLMVALQTEEQFAEAEGTYTQMMAADAATETVTFEGVEPGSYAAAAVHDTNENGEIDMGETGPTEGWGLSGGAQDGAPQFDPAMFAVTETGGSADVALTYPE